MKKIISAILVLLTIFLCGCAKSKENLAMYSDNYEVTDEMFSYFFNVQYISFITANKDSLSDYNLDTSVSLKEQNCSIASGTWHDYFADSAADTLERYLVLSEKARSDKKDLSKEKKEELESSINAIKDIAKEKGVSTGQYIKDNFGKNVTLSTVEECLKMELLANEYYEEYCKTLKTDDTVLQNYYENHIRDFAKADYLCMAVNADKNSSITDSGYEYALKLKSAKSETEFLKLCKDYLYNYYLEKYGEKDSGKAKSAADNALSGIKYTGAYYKGDSASSWAFSKGLKAGDTALLKDSEKSYYYVYYLVKAPYREEYKSVNLRQLMFSNADFGSTEKAKEKAEECLKTLKDNNFSSDTFSRLAKEFSSDEGTKNSGGVYKNVKKGTLLNADKIEDWIFENGRKEKDCSLIFTDAYGWHIVYIESFGEPVWKDSVKSAYCSYKFNLYTEDLGDSYIVRKNNLVIENTEETEQ